MEMPRVTQTIGEGQGATLDTSRINVIRRTAAAARVLVFTHETYDGPDTVILRSTDYGSQAPGADTCAFWQEMAVADGTVEDGRMELAFTGSGNESTANEEMAEAPASDVKQILERYRYELVWRPLGSDGDAPEEVVLMEAQPYPHVWNVGETASVLRSLLAVDFAECADAQLPGESARNYRSDDPLALPNDPAIGFPATESEEATEESGSTDTHRSPDGTAAGDHPEMADPAGNNEPAPPPLVSKTYAAPVLSSMTPVASRSPDPAGEEAADEEGDSKDGESYTLPDGDRWIHLFRRDDRDSDSTNRTVDHLGSFYATQDATYRRCAYTDDDLLEASGPEQTCVLIPLSTDAPIDDAPDEEWMVFSRLSMVPLSAQRIQLHMDTLRRGWLAPRRHGKRQLGEFTPVGYKVTDGGTAVYSLDGPHDTSTNTFGTFPGTWEMSATGGDDAMQRISIPLINPLATLTLRVQRATAAYRRLHGWQRKQRGARQLSSVVHAACYDDIRGRPYLSEHLASRRDVDRMDLNMADIWNDLGRLNGVGEVPDPPPDNTLLSHFAYGMKCQETFLRARVHVAQADADRWVESHLNTHTLPLDVLSAPADNEHVPQVAEQWAVAYAQLMAAGGGASFTKMAQQSDLLQEILEALDVPLPEKDEEISDEDHVQAVLDAQTEGIRIARERLEEAMGLPFADALDAEPFKLAMKLAATSVNAYQNAYTAFSPGITSVGFEAQGWKNTTVRKTCHLHTVFLAEGREPDVSTTVGSFIDSEAGQFGHSFSFTRGPDLQSKVYVVSRGLSFERGERTNTFLDARTDEHHGRPRSPDVVGVLRQTSVRLHGQIAIDFDAVLERAAVAAEWTGLGLSIVDMMINGYVLTSKIKDGTITNADMVGFAKLFTDSAGIVQGAGEAVGRNVFQGSKSLGSIAQSVGSRTGTAIAGDVAKSVGRKLIMAGPYMDALEISVSTVIALRDTDERGRMEAANPDVAGALGSVLVGVGSTVLVGAFFAASAPAAVVGLAAVGVGAGLLMWQEWEDQQDIEQADPLAAWLPGGSLWGGDYAETASMQEAAGATMQALTGGAPTPGKAYDALFALAMPGGDRSAEPVPEGLIEALVEQTETLVDKAFLFPTQVRTRFKPPVTQTDSVEALRLSILQGYLPAYGTLMVSAVVEATSDTPGLGTTRTDIRCAVHYVAVERTEVYFTVTGEGETLDLPTESSTTLSAWAQQHWTRAEVEEHQLVQVTAARGAASAPGAGDASGRETRIHSLRHYKYGHKLYESSLEMQAAIAEAEVETVDVPVLHLDIGAAWPEAILVEGAPGGVRGWFADSPREEQAEVIDRYLSRRPWRWANANPKAARDLTNAHRRALRTLQVMEGSQSLPLGRGEGRRLARIVASGRFRVQGFVYLNPLQPLQPAPQIPEGELDAESRLLAVTRISQSEDGYTFPEDAPEWVESASSP